ncbi:MAG: hypothetical protein CME71_04250 [Halobacteriovorax sp.]|nr:hypothetical protein [Halobacteriovorax sp.]|tara:strand:- start:1286 stop:1756 length:471 start_codon:yes stop_codon:yes gene_type:complete
MFFEDEWFMKMALEQAEHASNQSEVPVGAVIVDQAGIVLAKGHNLKEQTNNPCGHAEIVTIMKACEQLEDWRLENTTLYVTLEPCAMCAGAIIHSRIGRVVFGAYDHKGGVLSCSMNLFGNQKLNHKVEIVGGVLHFECAKQLSVFFKQRRSGHKQ